MSAAPAYPLHAQRGGLAPANLPDLPRPRMTPAEIPLTLSANVLRLPLKLSERVVLAEIVSLHAATGCCDASDPHFAARLGLNKDTVSVAIKVLEAEGLVHKVVVPVQGGKYRTLTPNPAAIAAKAATNPYPEVEVNTRRNFRRVDDSHAGNSGFHTPEIPAAQTGNSGLHTPEKPVSHAGNSGGNTPLNIPSNIPLTTDTACAVGGESKKKLVGPAQPEKPNASASHTEGGAVDVATSIPKGKPAKVAPDEAPAFLAFWQAYPRHDGKAKAAQSFARLKPDEQALATALAPAFFARRTDWISPEGTDYRPHAATWLNGKRWKEAAEPQPTPTATTPSHAHSANLKPGAARHHVPEVTSYGSL